MYVSVTCINAFDFEMAHQSQRLRGLKPPKSPKPQKLPPPTPVSTPLYIALVLEIRIPDQAGLQSHVKANMEWKRSLSRCKRSISDVILRYNWHLSLIVCASVVAQLSRLAVAVGVDTKMMRPGNFLSYE